MTAGTPWWITLLVALVGLGGVLWTQYRADAREQRNAELEDRRRRATMLHEAYQRLFALMDEAVEMGGYDRQDLRRIVSTIGLLAPTSILVAVEPVPASLKELSDAIAQHGGGSDEYKLAQQQATEKVAKAKDEIRRMLRVDAA